MAKKSAIFGEYIVQVEDNQHVNVFKIFDNVKESLRQASDEVGYQYDRMWNTRYFGKKLIETFGEGNSAVVGHFYIAKRDNGSIDTYRSFSNTKEVLRQIAEDLGFSFDPKWTTQQLGSKLVDFKQNGGKSSSENILSETSITVTNETSACESLIPDNEIWYTSEEPIETKNRDWFDVDVVEETFSDNKGVIRCSDSIKRINCFAFENNSYLETITLPNSLEFIDEMAFCGCNYLESFEGKFATADHTALVINHELFKVATVKSKEYLIPEGVERISRQAFGRNVTIEHLILPKGCNQVASSALCGLRNLKGVTFVDTLVNFSDVIDHNSPIKYFEGPCVSEDKRCVVLGNELVAFAAAGLKRYVIPQGVKVLGDSVFSGCCDLKKIVIPDGVEEIKSCAFTSCDQLSAIVLPSTVKCVGSSALDTYRKTDLIFHSEKPLEFEEEELDFVDAEEFEGTIYVPKSNLEDYKSAKGWSVLADKIKTIEDYEKLHPIKDEPKKIVLRLSNAAVRLSIHQAQEKSELNELIEGADEEAIRDYFDCHSNEGPSAEWYFGSPSEAWSEESPKITALSIDGVDVDVEDLESPKWFETGRYDEDDSDTIEQYEGFKTCLKNVKTADSALKEYCEKVVLNNDELLFCHYDLLRYRLIGSFQISDSENFDWYYGYRQQVDNVEYEFHFEIPGDEDFDPSEIKLLYDQESISDPLTGDEEDFGIDIIMYNDQLVQGTLCNEDNLDFEEYEPYSFVFKDKYTYKEELWKDENWY